MAARAFLCGAHSVGKTTLLQELQRSITCKDFSSTRFESEVARTVIADMKLELKNRDPSTHPDKFEDLQNEILLKQSAIEKRNDSLAFERCFYFMDRAAIDPLVYARVYLGDDAYESLVSRPHAQECINRYRNDSSLVFVVKPQPECIEYDGTRLPPKLEDLKHFTDVMIQTLKELRISFVSIDVLDLDKRVEIVKETLQTRNITVTSNFSSRI